MKKKKPTTVRSSTLVRANKSGKCPACKGKGRTWEPKLIGSGPYECPICKGTGRRGSGLPGAAQRARSRQKMADLRGRINALKHDLYCSTLSYRAMMARRRSIADCLRTLRSEYKALRRPFGANGGLSDERQAQ